MLWDDETTNLGVGSSNLPRETGNIGVLEQIAEATRHRGLDVVLLRLHRNILLREGANVAKQVLPMSLYDSEDPEDLWKWMKIVEEKTGGHVLAIPHNGNLSNGLMFDDVKLKTKKPLDEAYARNRARWEPVVEVTQPKGTGEAHPFLSPDDDFADFELIDKVMFRARRPKPRTC
jgi:Protein of unknown function (DUF3604)